MTRSGVLTVSIIAALGIAWVLCTRDPIARSPWFQGTVGLATLIGVVLALSRVQVVRDAVALKFAWRWVAARKARQWQLPTADRQEVERVKVTEGHHWTSGTVARFCEKMAALRKSPNPDASRIQGAVEVALETYRTRRECGDVLGQLAEALRDARRLDEAANAFRFALDLSPDNPALSVSLATVFRYRKDYAEARTMLTTARRKYPNNTFVLWNLGLLLKQYFPHDVKEAIRIFEELRDLGSPVPEGTATVNANLGTLYYQDDRSDEGRRAFRIAVDAYEDAGEMSRVGRTFFQWARALERDGQIQEAIEKLREACRLLSAHECGEQRYLNQTKARLDKYGVDPVERAPEQGPSVGPQDGIEEGARNTHGANLSDDRQNGESHTDETGAIAR